MAETYSVRAVLSAYDKGFTSAMKAAGRSTDSLGSKVKSGLGFGILTGVGQQAFNYLTQGVTGLISEIDSSNAAWQNFNNNMKIIGKGSDEISSVKKDLQQFAEESIYSSSDMANTYAQLASVGTKNCAKLVKGFGGLASASENPQQAMKTLSTQATQLAAKPYVAWQDFKLMYEQAPSGMAAVAKQMGMSMSELMKGVQNGTVKTNEFFKAIEEVGNNKDFAKSATTYKTIGQALDGLRETVGNKLTPAFAILSKVGVKGISGIIDKISKIDGEALAKSLKKGMEKAQPYFDALKTVAATVGQAIKKVGKFLLDHGDTIAKITPYALGLVVAYKGFKVVRGLAGPMMKFSKSILDLASGGLSGLAEKLLGVAGGETATATASEAGAGQVLKMAISFLALGAGVALVGAGFLMLSVAAVNLANAGPLAIACMVGMLAAIVGLAYGASIIGPALTVGAVGFIAFGAAVLLVGAGIALASAGMALLANKLPLIANYGLKGALAITAIGGAMLVFATGTLLAGTACVVLAAGLTVAAGGIALIGAACLIAGAGMIVFGVGTLLACVGILAMGIALKTVNSSMKSIASNALKTCNSLEAMTSSISIVKSGLSALGSKAKSAMDTLIDSFNNGASKAKGAGQKVGTDFTNAMTSFLNKAPDIALKQVDKAISKLRAGHTRAYEAGAYFSKGFAKGMSSKLGEIRTSAQDMADAADKAVRAKAKIHSPSKVSDKLGNHWGTGFVNGLLSMRGKVASASASLVSIPTVATPSISGYSGALDAENSYYRNTEYTITVPVNLDGKQTAKVIAPFTETELNKLQNRASRRNGIR